MSPPPSTIVAALVRRVAEQPGQPLVTYYDGSTGERVELSAATFDNWVSKIANLLSDDIGAAPGELVRVDLPAHWQSTVTLMGAWTAGLRVSLGARGANAAVSVVGPAAVEDPGSVEGQAIACSLRPLGGAFQRDLPAGWLDFAREVPSQPDLLLVASAVDRSDVALDTARGPVSHVELLDEARLVAADLDLRPGGRLVTDANPATELGLATALVAPIVSGCSVVLAVNCDTATVTSIAEQERATASRFSSD